MRISIILLSCILLGFTSAAAEDATQPSLSTLMTQLGSKEFDVREAADRTLKQRLTSADLPMLREAAAQKGAEPEVVARLAKHLRRLELGFEPNEWTSTDALAALVPDECKPALKQLLQAESQDSSAVGYAGIATDTWKAFALLDQKASDEFWRAAAVCNNPVVRAYATTGLSKRNTSTLMDLERGLYDTSEYKYCFGCTGGTESRDTRIFEELKSRPEALPLFARYLKYGESVRIKGRISAEAGAALLAAKMLSIETLIEQAKMTSTDERSGALMALALFKRPDATAAVVEALRDKDAVIKLAAIAALEHAGDKARWADMRPLAHDANLRVRLESISAGVRLAGADALPELDALLQDRSALNVTEVRNAIADAICELPEDAFLTRALAGTSLANMFGGQEKYVKRFRAVDKAKAAPIVLFIVKSGMGLWDIDGFSALALELGSPEQCKPVFRELFQKSKDVHRRSAAMKALGVLKDNGSLDLFKEGLIDDNPYTRIEAIKSLGAIATPEAVKLLEEALAEERKFEQANPGIGNRIKDIDEALKRANTPSK